VQAKGGSPLNRRTEMIGELLEQILTPPPADGYTAYARLLAEAKKHAEGEDTASLQRTRWLLSTASAYSEAFLWDYDAMNTE
jgi:hypothetical protein